MLSKEEIKHILDANVDIITYKADKDFRCLTSTEKALLENNEKIKEYIEELEEDNYESNNIISDYIDSARELTERIEELIKKYNNEFVYVDKMIDENKMSPDTLQELACITEDLEELLSIVKGEKL